MTDLTAIHCDLSVVFDRASSAGKQDVEPMI
jgi:hypothetical protein